MEKVRLDMAAGGKEISSIFASRPAYNFNSAVVKNGRQAKSDFAGLARSLRIPYRQGWMIRFSLFKIPVEIQPFFWVTLVLFGGARGADTADAVFQILLFVLAGFISILVHELGHALTARAFGAASQITLQAFGGLARYSGVRLNRLQSFLVTAAGPAIQLCLGALVWLLFWFRLLPPVNENGLYFLSILMVISFVWAIINLLPVLPLDGGQLVNAILGPQRIRITLWISIIVGGLTAVAMFKWQQPYFALLLCIFAWQAFQALKEIRWR